MSAVKFELDLPSGSEMNVKIQPEAERLCQGDNLSRQEFIRIWEQLPNLKQAELIDGVVYMPSPIGLPHGTMSSLVGFWLSTYKFAMPFCQSASNVTWFMQDSAPQPDLFLRLLPEFGGQSGSDKKFPTGAPELAVEIASSSVAYDLHQKLNLYREAGVQEYLVVVLRKPEIRWYRRVENRFELQVPDADRINRSVVFPGLWLNETALMADDMSAVIATLQEGLRSPEHAEFVARLKAHAAKQSPEPGSGPAQS
ncbi:Uma2 family endonuclease [soil metagenome]